MRKVMQYPYRLVGAALTLVGAAIVFVLFVPIASAGRPSGTDEVKGYANKKGQVTHKVSSEGQWFYVLGKNLNTVLPGDSVFCWDQAYNTWSSVADWGYVGASKALYVYADSDCIGNNSAIAVEFGDGNFVVGPRLAIT